MMDKAPPTLPKPATGPSQTWQGRGPRGDPTQTGEGPPPPQPQAANSKVDPEHLGFYEVPESRN